MLADKEVVMSALNIKSMSFDGADIVKLRDDIAIMGEDDPEPNMVNLLLDLSFATNVRYLDEQEIYLSDNIELTKGGFFRMFYLMYLKNFQLHEMDSIH